MKNLFVSSGQRYRLLTEAEWEYAARAGSSDEKTYYRLDGVIREGKSFDWPLRDVVSDSRLRRDDIGLTGYFIVPQHEKWIYVPIDGDGNRKTLARIIGSESFSRAFWRYARLVKGLCGPMSDWIKLSPPEFHDQPIEINLPNTLGSEICVEATAEPVRGNGWVSGLWKIKSVE